MNQGDGRRTWSIKENNIEAKTDPNEVGGWFSYNTMETASLRSTMGRTKALKKSVSCSPTSLVSNSHCETVDSLESKKTGKDLADGSAQKCAFCGLKRTKWRTDIIPASTSDSTYTVFCSENCSLLSRRSNLRRTKICDWCKHIRHTMSYVGFYDGDHQLQFCSDKCLNQYKMHLFCKEATAHLPLKGSNLLSQPHTSISSNNFLITPDLWLKNSPKALSSSSLELLEDESSSSDASSLPIPEDLTIKKTTVSTVTPVSHPISTPKRKYSEISSPEIQSAPTERKLGNNNHEAKESLRQVDNSDCEKPEERRKETSDKTHHQTIPGITSWIDPCSVLMTPYPILIPLPIPIPIPIPLHVYAECVQRFKKETSE